MNYSPLWEGFSYKPHQVAGIEWLHAQEQKNPSGGVVCDEMGLGKTIQLVSLVKSKPRTHTLLIAPVAVLTQWEDTAWRSGITVLRPGKLGYHRKWIIQGKFRPMASKLYIIGYEAARLSQQFLAMVEWTRVICDEAHRLCSRKSSLHSMVETIQTKSRWLLTATPVINSMNDMKNLLTLIGAKIPSGDIMPVVREYVMARSMEDLRGSGVVAPPPPVSHKQVLPFLTELEGDFYRGLTGAIVKSWKALDDEATSGSMKLKLFMRLRQLSLHPQVYIEARRATSPAQDRPDWIGSSTKFDAIHALIKEGVVANTKPHKWIIFCHFHSEMNLLKYALESSPDVGNVFIYNGAMNHSERKAVISKTHEPSTTTDVLIIQLQSGGVGLNLQNFDRIIFSGPWWTSALMEQAIGRAVRIGQTEVVHVYHLVLKEEVVINIDRLMTDKADMKGSLCREVLKNAWPSVLVPPPITRDSNDKKETSNT
jgi:SNF2 family DNA or RNA helicase